jgi:hypothetical protein
VLALVVLAGCSSFGGVSTTRQPFDVQDTTTKPPTDETTVDSPPVIAFDPVTDTAPGAFDLMEAHYGKLSGQSYMVQYDRVERFANGTVRSSDRSTTTYGPDRSRYVQERRASVRNWAVNRQLYANGSAVWSRTRYNESGEPNVRLLQSPRGEPVPPANVAVRAVPSALESGLVATNVTDVRALDTVPSGVDDQVFQVTANETAAPNSFGDRTLSVSLLLIVTEEGRIIEYTLETTFVRDGERVHSLTRVQFRGVGRVSVDRPDWIPANGTPTNETTADGPNAIGSTPTGDAGTETLARVALELERSANETWTETRDDRITAARDDSLVIAGAPPPGRHTATHSTREGWPLRLRPAAA